MDISVSYLMTYRVLIVDDEPKIRKLISDFLKKDGYLTEEAINGEDAMDKWKHQTYDVILLDVMMPKMNGWEVCKEIRKTSKIPIIMLTAKSEEDDELMGFKLGVDDYITKPFSPKVLLARLNLLMNKQKDPVDVLEYHGITVNISSHTAFVDQQPLILSFKEFELLTYFMKHVGIALSREKIMSDVWNYDYFGDARTIDTHVKTLRAKLKEYEKDEMIKTVWGLGYKFE